MHRKNSSAFSLSVEIGMPVYLAVLRRKQEFWFLHLVIISAINRSEQCPLRIWLVCVYIHPKPSFIILLLILLLKPVWPHLPMLKLSSCSRPRRAGSKLSSWLPVISLMMILMILMAILIMIIVMFLIIYFTGDDNLVLVGKFCQPGGEFTNLDKLGFEELSNFQHSLFFFKICCSVGG